MEDNEEAGEWRKKKKAIKVADNLQGSGLISMYIWAVGQGAEPSAMMSCRPWRKMTKQDEQPQF